MSDRGGRKGTLLLGCGLALGCGLVDLPWTRPGWVEEAAVDPDYPNVVWYNHGRFVAADFDGDGLEDVAYSLLDPSNMLGVAIVLRREMQVRAFADPGAPYAIRIGGHGCHEWAVTEGEPAVLTVWNGCRFSWDTTSEDFSVSCPTIGPQTEGR